jgi:renal tumor antigen
VHLHQLKGHPNIVELVDVNYDRSTGYVCMLFELLEKNLYELIEGKEPLDEQIVLLYIYQMLKGLAFMHGRLIFHRDIKPENCMVNTTTHELKLVDLGSARTYVDSGPFTEYVATRWYRAPECLLTAGSYAAPIDIWAVGCILFELLTGKPLFPGRDEFEQMDLIHKLIGTPDPALIQRFLMNRNDQFNFEFPYCPGINFEQILPNCADTTVDLMRCLLTYDPAIRITAADSLQHPALAALHALDLRWEKSDWSTPFPLYALEGLKRMQAEAAAAAHWRASGYAVIQHREKGRLLMNTRLKAAQRIKDYKTSTQKSRVYFSLHTQKLQPMVPQKHTTFAEIG